MLQVHKRRSLHYILPSHLKRSISASMRWNLFDSATADMLPAGPQLLTASVCSAGGWPCQGPHTADHRGHRPVRTCLANPRLMHTICAAHDRQCQAATTASLPHHTMAQNPNPKPACVHGQADKQSLFLTGRLAGWQWRGPTCSACPSARTLRCPAPRQTAQMAVLSGIVWMHGRTMHGPPGC